jgi:hypothetical protein
MQGRQPRPPARIQGVGVEAAKIRFTMALELSLTSARE